PMIQTPSAQAIDRTLMSAIFRYRPPKLTRTVLVSLQLPGMVPAAPLRTAIVATHRPWRPRRRLVAARLTGLVGRGRLGRGAWSGPHRAGSRLHLAREGFVAGQHLLKLLAQMLHAVTGRTSRSEQARLEQPKLGLNHLQEGG